MYVANIKKPLIARYSKLNQHKCYAQITTIIPRLLKPKTNCKTYNRGLCESKFSVNVTTTPVGVLRVSNVNVNLHTFTFCSQAPRRAGSY